MDQTPGENAVFWICSRTFMICGLKPPVSALPPSVVLMPTPVKRDPPPFSRSERISFCAAPMADELLPVDESADVDEMVVDEAVCVVESRLSNSCTCIAEFR